MKLQNKNRKKAEQTKPDCTVVSGDWEGITKVPKKCST